MSKDKRKTKPMKLMDAVAATGWSRGTLLRRCWAGEVGKQIDGVWYVTLAELEKVGLGKRTISTIKPAKPKKAATVPAAKPSSPAASPASSTGAVLRNQHLVLVLDNSGSMNHIKRPANEMMKTMAEQFKADFDGAGFDTQTSTYLFGSYVTPLVKRSSNLAYPVGSANEGSTSLNDAIVQAIKDSRATERPDEAVLILVITDGGENSSRNTVSQAGGIVREAKATGRYTISLAGPASVEHTVRAYAAQLELEQGNVTTWEQSHIGTQVLASKTVAASASYTAARGAGGSSVQNFYSVTTDLSKVDEKAVAGLRNINSRFRKAKAEKETDVTSYYTEKMGGRPYVTGAVYYQLVKREKVQPYKEVLLRHKQTGNIYGNEDARKLLGLTSDTDTANVKPGNNAWYDIFIQSTSDNRILPRGSEVLIDKQRTVSLPRSY